MSELPEIEACYAECKVDNAAYLDDETKRHQLFENVIKLGSHEAFTKWAVETFKGAACKEGSHADMETLLAMMNCFAEYGAMFLISKQITIFEAQNRETEKIFARNAEGLERMMATAIKTHDGKVKSIQRENIFSAIVANFFNSVMGPEKQTFYDIWIAETVLRERVYDVDEVALQSIFHDSLYTCFMEFTFSDAIVEILPDAAFGSEWFTHVIDACFNYLPAGKQNRMVLHKTMNFLDQPIFNRSFCVNLITRATTTTQEHTRQHFSDLCTLRLTESGKYKLRMALGTLYPDDGKKRKVTNSDFVDRCLNV